MKSFLKTLLKSEEGVIAATRDKYQNEFALFDQALELFIERVSLFGNKQLDPSNKLQSARLHLMIRSIKSVRMAKLALLLGYYQQAITLMRMVAENDLVTRDAAICKATLDGLLLDTPLRETDSDDIRIPRFSEMARRQSSEFMRWWQWYYGRLSIYGAHPRNASMSNLGHHIPTEKAYILKVESFYDEARVKPLLWIAAAELWRLFESTNKLVETAIKDKTPLDEPQLSWPEEGPIELGKSLYSLGYEYIFRLEDWEDTEEVSNDEL